MNMLWKLLVEILLTAPGAEVDVSLGIQVMALLVLILTNAPTEAILVMKMHPVKTPTVPSTVCAMRGIQVMALIVLILTNAPTEAILVMIMHPAKTPTVPSTVCATPRGQVMDGSVFVQAVTGLTMMKIV